MYYREIKIVVANWHTRSGKRQKHAWKAYTRDPGVEGGWIYRCDCNRHFDTFREAVLDARDFLGVTGSFWRQKRNFIIEQEFKAPKPKES